MSDQPPTGTEPERTKPDPTPAAGGPPDDDDERASPFGWFPLVILIVLIVGGLFVMFELRDVSNIQDCVQSGRRNCAPIDTTNVK
jgi:hypothetical protein